MSPRQAAPTVVARCTRDAVSPVLARRTRDAVSPVLARRTRNAVSPVLARRTRNAVSPVLARCTRKVFSRTGNAVLLSLLLMGFGSAADSHSFNPWQFNHSPHIEAHVEKRLKSEFQMEFMNGSGISALKRLRDYYVGTGHPEQLQPALESVFVPGFGCGTVKLQWARVVLEYCKRLKAAGENELLDQCISYADFDDHHYAPSKFCASPGWYSVADEKLRIEDLASKADLHTLRLRPEQLSLIDELTRSRVKHLEILGGEIDRDNFESASLFPNVESLVILACKFTTRDGMQSLGDLSKLQELEISDCKNASYAVPWIGKAVGLRNVRLLRNGIQILTGFGTLSELRVFQCEEKIDDVQLKSFEGLTQLEEVSISSPLFYGEGLQSLARSKGLRKLELNHCKYLTPKVAETIADFSNLEELDLFYTPLQFKDLRALTRLGKLQVLSVEDRFRDDDWLDLVCSLPSVKELDLRHCVPAREHLQKVAHMKGLETLVLPLRVRESLDLRSEYGGITDSDMLLFAYLPRLKDLSVEGVGVSGSVFENGFKSIENLRIGSSSVDDRGLEYISELPQLKVLSIVSPRLEGKTINRLSNCKELGELDVYCKSFQLENVPKIAEISSLKTLRLTRFTIDGLRTLKARLPDCSVEPSLSKIEAALQMPLEKAMQ